MTTEIDMCIEASSISTGDTQRDDFLRSSEFLDVKKHQQILFNSKEIKKTEKEGLFELYGDLTIKGITETIKLDLQLGELSQDITGKERVDLTATGRINRRNWDLNWNIIMAAGGLMVDEEITILCEIQLIKGTDSDPLLERVSSREKVTVPVIAGILGQLEYFKRQFIK